MRRGSWSKDGRFSVNEICLGLLLEMLVLLLAKQCNIAKATTSHDCYPGLPAIAFIVRPGLILRHRDVPVRGREGILHLTVHGVFRAKEIENTHASPHLVTLRPYATKGSGHFRCIVVVRHYACWEQANAYIKSTEESWAPLLFLPALIPFPRPESLQTQVLPDFVMCVLLTSCPLEGVGKPGGYRSYAISLAIANRPPFR